MYAIAIILKNTYQKRQIKIKSKQNSSISAPAASRVTRVTELTIQRREEKRQEVKSAAAAASLTHTHQAVHVHSS